jgi:hypothetical protein
MMRQDASVTQNLDAAAIGFIQKVSASILGIRDLSDTDALLRVVLDLAEQLVRKRQREFLQKRDIVRRAVPSVPEAELAREVEEMDGIGEETEGSARVLSVLASLEEEMRDGEGDEEVTPSSGAATPGGAATPPSGAPPAESVRSKLERLRQIAQEFQA